MAGADASIYNLIQPARPRRGPMDMYQDELKIRNLMDQQGTAALQRRELEGGLQRRGQLRDLMQSNPNASIDQIRAIDPDYAMQYQDSMDKRQRSQADLLKIDRENFLALARQAQEDMKAATPQNWASLRDRAIQSAGMFSTEAIRNMALQAAQAMPAQFDPEYVRRNVLSGEQLFMPKPQAVGGKVMDMNPSTNPNIVGQDVPPTASEVSSIQNRELVPDGQGGFRVNTPLVTAKSQISAAGAPRVNIDQRAEGTYAQKVAGGAAERDEGLVKSAQSAVDNIQKLDSVIDHLKTSQAITGLGSDLLKNVERARVLFTQSKAAGKAVSDTELLDSMLGSDVFPMIQALGIGARGMDTPAEREFLRSVMTGTTSMNKDTLVRMAEIRRDIAKRAVDKYNAQVDSGELDRYFQYSGAKKGRINLPKAPTPPRQSSGASGGFGKDPVRINGDDGYNMLPKGAHYIGPDGVERVK